MLMFTFDGHVSLTTTEGRTGAFRLTALAEVMQGLPVALQVLVDGVALVVWLQALQHV